MSRARYYQTDVKLGCYHEWGAGNSIIMPVVPTGGGKTHIVGEVVRELQRPTLVEAHRRELVGQISMALARENIRHDILAPKNIVKAIVGGHMDEEDIGRSYYDPRSPVKVVGVDTLIERQKDSTLRAWLATVGLGVIDEGHHVLKGNKWGDSIDLVAECKREMLGTSAVDAWWMLPTATACRADGKGLGRHADGYVDALVFGPEMRRLIEEGYLTDYRVFCPRVPSDLDLSNVPISEATGDLSQGKLRAEVHKSRQLVGDVVKHYLRIAPGKLGVTFAVDVEAATEIAQAFRDAGVPAEVITAKTPDVIRRSILRAFRNREILQLVNVDLFGEGFDLPAIEVVSMARPTESYGLYAQQFGRALRLMVSKFLMGAWDTYTPGQRKQFIMESGKPTAIIIDHVGNVERHGLPDKPRPWSLERRERRERLVPIDAIPLRVCLNEECIQPYERIYKACPYCGTAPPPPAIRDLKFVDGDLTELDPAILAVMRGEAIQLGTPAPNLSGISHVAQRGAWNTHRDSQQAQTDLRHAMNSWAAVYDADGESVRYRRFYFTFGVDVATAMSYTTNDAKALLAKIETRLAREGYYVPPPKPMEYMR